MIALLLTVCSALLYGGAFLFPEYMWWGSLLCAVPLFLSASKSSRAFLLGFAWGLIAYGLHSIWIFRLLHMKSNASFVQAVGIYCVLVAYFASSSAIGLFAWKKIVSYMRLGRVLSFFVFLIISSFYFIMLKKCALLFTFSDCEYPFFSQIIPLVSSRRGLCMVRLILCLIMPSAREAPGGAEQHDQWHNQVLYCPLESRAEMYESSDLLAERLYYSFARLRLHERVEKNKPYILVMPESAYPFPLNKECEWIKQWGEVLPDNVYLIMGAQREGEKPLGMGRVVRQSAFLINQGRIMQAYDKRLLVPFVEQTPEIWNFSWIKNLFNKEKIELSEGKRAQGANFSLTHTISLQPYLCSELFLSSHALHTEETMNNSTEILWLVNDSWFENYFKTMLENYAYIMHLKLKKTIFYAAHSRFLIFQNNQLHAQNNALKPMQRTP